MEKKYDLVTNTIKPTYPDGFDFWIFNRKSLNRSFKYAKLKYQREHMAQYMIDNPKKFKIYNFYQEEIILNFVYALIMKKI